MEAVFLKLLSMSLSASGLILIVAVLRYVLMDAPKAIRCVLWALVAVRLVCPFSLESAFSLIPDSISTGEAVNDWVDDYAGSITLIHEGSEFYDAAVEAGREPIEADSNGGCYVVTGADGVSPPPTVGTTRVPIYSRIWLAGMTALMGYALISYLRLRRRVAPSIRVGKDVYICDYIDSPFILGILWPRIYLPSSLQPDSASYVLAHERAHLKRFDHWWKPLGYVLLTVYWFNPVIWLAYILLCRDIELACDERVIKEMGTAGKKAYSEALLSCSVSRRMIAACPLAFGEVGVKERVKNVLNFKKPAFWVIAVAVAACAIVAVCFLTDPKTQNEEQEMAAAGAQSEVAQLLGVENVVIFDVIDYGSARFEGVGYDGKAAVAYYEKSAGEYELIEVQPCDTSGDYAHFASAEMDILIHAITNPDVIGIKWTGGYEEMVLLEERPALVLLDMNKVRSGMEIKRESIYGYSYQFDESGTYFEDKNSGNVYFMNKTGEITQLDQTDIEFWPNASGRVTWGNDMSILVPQGWKLDVGTMNTGVISALTLYPEGQDTGLLIRYMTKNNFAVCGTGLITEDILLPPYRGTAGYYDGSKNWSYLLFPGVNGDCVITCDADAAWWEQYGEEAMEILETLEIGDLVMTHNAVLDLAEDYAEELVYDRIFPVFNHEQGTWTVTFYRDNALVSSFQLDAAGHMIGIGAREMSVAELEGILEILEREQERLRAAIEAAEGEK